MTKTLVQKLWENISELQTLLGGNPHPHIEECKALVAEMEERVKALRRREMLLRGK